MPSEALVMSAFAADDDTGLRQALSLVVREAQEESTSVCVVASKTHFVRNIVWHAFATNRHE
jgi:hypothetical protein